MAIATLGYAVLCTDAYILNMRSSHNDPTFSLFDIALPCGDRFLGHDQPVLTCSLQHHSPNQLAHVASGVYHIRAKV